MSSPIDYNKLTIPKLKDELKKRGISITGLKKKNEFIEKLEQDDKEKVVTEKDPPSTTIEKVEEIQEVVVEKIVEVEKTIETKIEEKPIEKIVEKIIEKNNRNNSCRKDSSKTYWY